MPALATSLRNTLESLVVKARDAAEVAAEAALERLAVHEASAYSSVGEEARRLLRAKARQLGDPLEAGNADPMPGLVRECAYEKWHAMPFAAFLAEKTCSCTPRA